MQNPDAKTIIVNRTRYQYLLETYLIGILIFTVFRLINTLVYCTSADPWPDFEGHYWGALLMGWRFDTVVSCYLLAIPLIMTVVGELAHIRAESYYKIIHTLLLVGYLVAFLACGVDVFFFNYFFSRLNAVSINELDSFGTVVSMIFGEPLFVAGILAFVAFAVGYVFLMRKVYRRVLRNHLSERLPLGWGIGLAVVLLLATFIGMRGRLSPKSPIRVGTAYFCNNGFLNQLGLNPVFTFVKSAEELGKASNRPVALASTEKASQTYEAERALAMDATLVPEGLSLPLPEGTHVVLVIMESMSVDKTGLFSPEQSMTPVLDSLMNNGLVFTQCYSAGIHTYNGIYSTLFSHPSILARHTMKHVVIPQMCGLPQQLQNQGYHTSFFLTHDEDYDNIRGFLRTNGFEEVLGESRYPKEKVVGTWGVPDHVMFDYVVDHCTEMASQGPFFVAMMTCSDHYPYFIPDGIDLKTKHHETKHRVVEYADWSIGRFMQKAAQQPWFGQTLFVFVADHGAAFPGPYDVSLSYHHIPLLFYFPGFIEPQRCDRLALQLDVSPTVMGMLPYPFENNAFGLDLLRQRRKWAYFSSDDKIGVLDGEYMYVYRTTEGHESLYHYCDTMKDDLIDREPMRAKEMHDYAFGMIQHSYQMLTEGKTACAD